MITALTVQEHKPTGKLGKLKNFFKRDYIKTEIITFQRLTIVHLIYHKYKDKINWQKIDQQAGYEKKTIFCDDSIKPPKYLGFRRYNYQTLMHRMAENTALEVLERGGISADKLKIGLLDPDGSKGELAEQLLKYTSNLTVVTDTLSLYSKIAENILENTGASFIIQKSAKAFGNCNMIISPKRINRYLPLKGNTVVLTGETPAIATQGYVFDGYRFKLPRWCYSIKPDSLSDEYFAQALYDKGKQYTLGSIIPFACVRNGEDVALEQVSTIIASTCENA